MIQFNDSNAVKEYLKTMGVVGTPTHNHLLYAITQVNKDMARVVGGEFNERLYKAINEFKHDINVTSILSKQLINRIADMHLSVDHMYYRYLVLRCMPLHKTEIAEERVKQIREFGYIIDKEINKHKINIILSNEIINICLNDTEMYDLFNSYNKFRSVLEYASSLPPSKEAEIMVDMVHTSLNNIYDEIIETLYSYLD